MELTSLEMSSIFMFHVSKHSLDGHDMFFVGNSLMYGEFKNPEITKFKLVSKFQAPFDPQAWEMHRVGDVVEARPEGTALQDAWFRAEVVSKRLPTYDRMGHTSRGSYTQH